MTARERGILAAHNGESIKANPYQEYYMRRHGWSGWRSQVSNPAWSEWRAGFQGYEVGAVKDAIRKALDRNGEMTEVDLGLAVMQEYRGELSSRLMNEAVRQMKYAGQLSDTLGTYKLITPKETALCDHQEPIKAKSAAE